MNLQSQPSTTTTPTGFLYVIPENSFASEQKKEPCPPVPDHPSDADIRANIGEAESHGPASSLNSVKPILYVRNMNWFYNQVRNKGPWDYKQQGKRDGRNYQDFGNFNFGATMLPKKIHPITLQMGWRTV